MDLVAFAIVGDRLIVPAKYYEGDQDAIEMALALHRAWPCLACVVVEKSGEEILVKTGDTAHFAKNCGRCQPCRRRRVS